eukprot:GHVS01028070.1.p1 GENE.GHVS01028070.1~~GHVS01028070.1.p1  ORF type:complete len:118 (+),score=6.71 GHVS01028070.1:294-647(+)
MDQFLVDRCPLILRIFTSCSALCFGASAITNFIISFRYLGYTPAIVNLIGFFFSVVALVCEFSPFGLNVLMAAVPCLGCHWGTALSKSRTMIHLHDGGACTVTSTTHLMRLIISVCE